MDLVEQDDDVITTTTTARQPQRLHLQSHPKKIKKASRDHQRTEQSIPISQSSGDPRKSDDNLKSSTHPEGKPTKDSKDPLVNRKLETLQQPKQQRSGSQKRARDDESMSYMMKVQRREPWRGGKSKTDGKEPKGNKRQLTTIKTHGRKKTSGANSMQTPSFRLQKEN